MSNVRKLEGRLLDDKAFLINFGSSREHLLLITGVGCDGCEHAESVDYIDEPTGERVIYTTCDDTYNGPCPD